MQLRDCPSYPGYAVDEEGNVYSRWFHGGGQYIANKLCGTNRKLAGSINFYGYRAYTIKLGGGKKGLRAQQIILDAFQGPKPFPGAMGCHRDGIKLNNHPSNLRWGTRKENSEDMVRHGHSLRGERHHNAKLSWNVIDSIRSMRRNGESARSLAAIHGVTPDTIRKAVRLDSWKSIVNEP